MLHYPNLCIPDSDETAPDEDEVDGGCGRDIHFNSPLTEFSWGLQPIFKWLAKLHFDIEIRA